MIVNDDPRQVMPIGMFATECSQTGRNWILHFTGNLQDGPFGTEGKNVLDTWAKR